MQFNVLALTVAAMAAVASAQEVVTVYACGPSSTPAPVPSLPPTVVAPPPGVVGSTGFPTAPAPTGSPIPPYSNGASAQGVSALGMVIAGGVALFL